MWGKINNIPYASKDCYLYSIKNDQWSILLNMLKPRYDFSLYYTTNELFAIGGITATSHGYVPMVDCEKYSFETSTWIPIKALEKAVISSAVFGYNECIWAFEKLKHNSGAKQVTQRYKIRYNYWEKLAFKIPSNLTNFTIMPTGYPNEVYIYSKYGHNKSTQYRLDLLNRSILLCSTVTDSHERASMFDIDGNFFAVLYITEIAIFIKIYRSRDNKEIDVKFCNEFDYPFFEGLSFPRLSFQIPYNPLTKLDFTKRDYAPLNIIFGFPIEPYQLEINSKTAEVAFFPLPLE